MDEKGGIHTSRVEMSTHGDLFQGGKNKVTVQRNSLDGNEFEQVLGVSDGQGGLACSSPWGCKESDMTELD